MSEYRRITDDRCQNLEDLRGQVPESRGLTVTEDRCRNLEDLPRTGVRMLCYSFSFGNQTDQGDETEGLEREGLKMGR